MKGGNASVAMFVHQTRVRRDAMVELSLGATQRGHRAYRRVDIDNAKAETQLTPEDVVPPEVTPNGDATPCLSLDRALREAIGVKDDHWRQSQHAFFSPRDVPAAFRRV